ncbi:hypothetical protein [Enterococcus rotai]|uniref:hypothetical protein n=1 Tax=Enterococcus rotai TaxID=118060 RepID=UPI0032B5651F
MKNVYSLIRNIVTNVDGFNINDVLQTDWDMLIEILCSQPEKKEKAISLEEFMNSVG